MKRHTLFALLSIAVVGQVHPAVPLVAHEWGTITTIHDAAGKPAVGLNRIAQSEVLPDFVHRFEPETTRHDPVRALIKSPIVPGRPDVNMRLETPVIYFYQTGGERLDVPFDVTVKFRGGVLNEFYPAATATVGVDLQRVASKMRAGVLKRWDGNVLNNYVVGQLTWKGLQITNAPQPPVTDSAIWLAPRAVRAPGIVTPDGESERYVFYRGVAHLDALFQTRLGAKYLRLMAPARLSWLSGVDTLVPQVWFADIRANGEIAFREQNKLELRAEAPGAEVARFEKFAAGDYSAAHAADLRASIKLRLVAQGLYKDEAEAMLETWQASYFKKPGLRVFYIVPETWLDYFLPLDISVPHELKRVIVGRIDLR